MSPTDATGSLADDSLIGHPADGDPGGPFDSSPLPYNQSSSSAGLTSTPIHSRYDTTERFGINDFSRSRIHTVLAANVAPYILGPMPPDAFLDQFLPVHSISIPDCTPSFQVGMFTSLLPLLSPTATDATGASGGASGGTNPYNALVCPPYLFNHYFNFFI